MGAALVSLQCPAMARAFDATLIGTTGHAQWKPTLPTSHSFPWLWKKMFTCHSSKTALCWASTFFSCQPPFSMSTARISCYLSERKEKIGIKIYSFPSTVQGLYWAFFIYPCKCTLGCSPGSCSAQPTSTGPLPPDFFQQELRAQRERTLENFGFFPTGPCLGDKCAPLPVAIAFAWCPLPQLCLLPGSAIISLWTRGGESFHMWGMKSFTSYCCLSLTLPLCLFNCPFFKWLLVSVLVSSLFSYPYDSGLYLFSPKALTELFLGCDFHLCTY